jgi:prepilin-type N-terminal cleavage/methylation domain-containing protein
MWNRIRHAASLIELLIALAIIGGFAAIIFTAARQLLKAAYRLERIVKGNQIRTCAVEGAVLPLMILLTPAVDLKQTIFNGIKPLARIILLLPSLSPWWMP